MAKIKMVYNPLSKEERERFDKSQQEFYEKVQTLSSQLLQKEMYKNHKKIELNYGR